MYTQFFNLTHSPFSIAPDPRFLFMSERHREALAHLLYGIGSGGFVMLTGEIGAGKTTVCRCFLEQIPDNCNVAYIFNPKLTVNELLKSICDEFRTGYQAESGDPASTKNYVDALNAFLLRAHAEGKNNVLIIDEAQSLSADVLEQLRLLTNLETNERKLLQIILIGQPELRTLLEKPSLKQLAQRIIARYHLGSLPLGDTARYVQHRLAVAGNAATTLFPPTLMKPIYRITQGVPRRINLLCDRALLGAYAEGRQSVSRHILDKAALEVFGGSPHAWPPAKRWIFAALGCAVLAAASMAIMVHPGNQGDAQRQPVAPSGAPGAIPATLPRSILPLDLDTPPAVSTEAGPAYRALAQLWRVTLPPGDPCALAQLSGLRCYKSNKGFAEIRQLDRPAILFLHDKGDHAYYAVLTELTDTQASLTIGGKTYAANLVALERHFHGDFATFWKIPAAYREKFNNGDSGVDVDWINTQLAKLSGAPRPAPNQGFDTATSSRIREFQSAQGLQADGVIGPKTFMQLNRAADNAEPHLGRDWAVVSASSRK